MGKPYVLKINGHVHEDLETSTFMQNKDSGMPETLEFGYKSSQHPGSRPHDNSYSKLFLMNKFYSKFKLYLIF